ncbi:MAG: LytTR family transcriptional regulator DNA-binding domain-containing protein [Lachnospiraceae bacterium]|nr:LytTR family transcriptional regulator DNA-binding domain-containing protein [Lachnospiraceae bacterium]
MGEPEVTIEYKVMSGNVKRVSDFVKSVDKVITCRKDDEEYSVPLNEIYYMESVDKKGFIYTKSEVYQSTHRLLELEKMLPSSGFVRVSRSAIINVEMLKGIKNLPNSKLEAILINDERICVNRNYLNGIRDVLLRRNSL